MIAFDEFGSGPDVVVLLHGTPCPPEVMAPLAEALAGHFRVLLPHLPGYGRTPPITADPSETLRALEDGLLARGIDRASLVGFSGGAYRALALAVSGRIAVDRVATIAGLANLSPAERDGFRQFAAALRAGVDLAGAMPARMFSAAFAAAHPEIALGAEGWVRGVAASHLAAELEAVAALPDLRPALAHYDGELLALVGERDVAAPVAHSEAIAAAVPHGRCVVVTGAGHTLHLERPEEVAEELLRFLRPAARQIA